MTLPRTTRPTLAVLRALGLGDLLTAVPALRALRRAFPAHELTLLAPAALAPLAALCGAVDRVQDTAAFTLPELAVRRPAVAVNLHGRGPASTRRLLETAPGRLVAFADPALGVAGPRWRAGEHEVARWCRLLAESGVPADPTDLALPVPPEPSPAPGAVVVHPGAAAPARRWPAGRYAAVAAELAAAGHRVVVTGGVAERALAARVTLAAGLPAAANLAGRTPLPALAALVARAALVVCGDTGVAHLATAFEVPSVLLFGPTSPRAWGPPAHPRHQVLWAGRAGDPHGRRLDPGLASIGVDEVLAAVERAGGYRARRREAG